MKINCLVIHTKELRDQERLKLYQFEMSKGVKIDKDSEKLREKAVKKIKVEYLNFFKNQCKRNEIFKLSDNFVEAVETKFKVKYLKDYVFATSLNEKLLSKFKYVN